MQNKTHLIFIHDYFIALSIWAYIMVTYSIKIDFTVTNSLNCYPKLIEL